MSDTKKTSKRREIRKNRMGQDRKKKLAKEGTTPKFPIHVEKK